uniref:NADH dehydrogenase subunit 4L n=1 Tax=Pycnogonum diceros TaxID=373309 RepID=UPI00226D305B|nr:NADH dehydrogenase subunit 4L [Pycnogonum diceros]UZA61231.1 NADH dehydrogenase subunit 4L [Pycnogonum diceros]
MMNGLFMCLFFLFFGFMSFFINRKNILLLLLSIEFIMLNVYFLMTSYLCYIDDDLYISLFFLTLSVCGASLGLSLLVCMTRFYGSESMLFFNLNY